MPLAYGCDDTVTYVFFFNDTATTEIYTLSLHDALPISGGGRVPAQRRAATHCGASAAAGTRAWTRGASPGGDRCGVEAREKTSEEHTPELQSHSNVVCRLLPVK